MPRMILDTQLEPLATGPQLDLLRSLCSFKDTGTMDLSKIDSGTLTKAQASAGIDWLKARPTIRRDPVNAPKAATRVPQSQRVSVEKEHRPTEVGYYVWPDAVTEIGDVYLRVVVNVKTDRLNYHVMTADSPEWEYRKYQGIDGLVKDYGEPDRMTLEDIARYGHTSDHCLCCGHDLSNPESLERGIGPVCFAKGEAGGMF